MKAVGESNSSRKEAKKAKGIYSLRHCEARSNLSAINADCFVPRSDG